MAEEKILDRVRKLLELSKSSNVNESAAAFAQAQKLMSRHNISSLMLETPGEVDEPVGHELLYADGRLAMWMGSLAVGMCGVNQCSPYRAGGSNQLWIVGRTSDAQTVRYLYSYVVNEIKRLCQRESDLRGNPGVQWRNDFCIGAANVVVERLKEAARQARAEMRQEADASDTLGNGVALVRVNSALARIDERRAEVDQWLKKNLKLKKSHYYRYGHNADGRMAGRRAGERIDLNGASKGLGSGSRGQLTQ
jgi:hypothetical protein